MEIRCVSCGGVTDLDVDAETSFSLVVMVFSELVVSWLVVVGAAVEVTAVRVGEGAGTGKVGKMGTAGGVSASSVLLVGATDSAVVGTVINGSLDVVIAPGLGLTVGGPRVVHMEDTSGTLVVIVTLAVAGLVVDLSIDVILGVTRGVVLKVVVRAMVVVVVAGVALAVDTNRVVTFSWKVVGLGTAVEVVLVCRGDQDGGGVVVDLVDTSTLPVTGCVVSVIGCTITGLSVVVTIPGGALVEMVVRSVSGLPGAGECEGVASFLVVVAAISEVEISGDVVVLVVGARAAANVAEVSTCFDVTGI